MEFLGGALPNVMFIIGIVAIGLGLGIELKLVALNKEIDKTGRIGAIVVGVLLVAASLFIYLNPALTNHSQTPSATANAALAPAAAGITAAPPVPTEASAAVAVAAPPAAPTALAAPLATIVPTDAPPPALAPSPVPPPATTIPMVKVPDLHDADEKAAQSKLTVAGLKFSKVNQCNGTDQGDPKPKKHRVLCQNPAANMDVPRGTTVEYVIR